MWCMKPNPSISPNFGPQKSNKPPTIPRDTHQLNPSYAVQYTLTTKWRHQSPTTPKKLNAKWLAEPNILEEWLTKTKELIYTQPQKSTKIGRKMYINPPAQFQIPCYTQHRSRRRREKPQTRKVPLPLLILFEEILRLYHQE